MDEATDIEGRLAACCQRRQLERLGPLGSGMHGNVFRASSPGAAGEVAIKVHLRREPFEVELETYLRLRDANVTQVLGFNVPQLLGYDADLLVLEMTVVQQPFVLDFAEVSLDLPREFPDDVWTHWQEEKQEQFGERWPVVQQVLAAFEALDIYLLDVSPRNIALRNW
jgi:hypothetical protein